MRRATVTLPDDLEEYLERRGFSTERAFRPFEITSAREDSGASDVSTNHDRYFAESAER